MQLSFDVRIPDGLLAANALLNEKPHQGVPSWNLALHQGIDERNSTAAIGIRASAQLNRIWPRYTGKERDTESGLDYFGARYYASNMGRWMSPDWADKPEAVPYSDLDNPQSLNLYGYVGNNPLSRADADGHWPDWFPGVWDGLKSSAGDTLDGMVTVSRAIRLDQDATQTIVEGAIGTAKDGWDMASNPSQTASDLKSGWASMSGREKAALITDTAIKGALVVGTDAAVTKLGRAAEVGAEGASQMTGLEKQIASHEGKLAAYKANPDKFDNKGILKGVSPERRQSIINGRVKHLQREIDAFKKELTKKKK